MCADQGSISADDARSVAQPAQRGGEVREAGKGPGGSARVFSSYVLASKAQGAMRAKLEAQARQVETHTTIMSFISWRGFAKQTSLHDGLVCAHDCM